MATVREAPGAALLRGALPTVRAAALVAAVPRACPRPMRGQLLQSLCCVC